MLLARTASCHVRCILDQIKANLVEIQPEKRQNVQKTRFLQKAPGFNGLIAVMGNSLQLVYLYYQ